MGGIRYTGLPLAIRYSCQLPSSIGWINCAPDVPHKAHLKTFLHQESIRQVDRLQLKTRSCASWSGNANTDDGHLRVECEDKDEKVMWRRLNKCMSMRNMMTIKILLLRIV